MWTGLYDEPQKKMFTPSGMEEDEGFPNGMRDKKKEAKERDEQKILGTNLDTPAHNTLLYRKTIVRRKTKPSSIKRIQVLLAVLSLARKT